MCPGARYRQSRLGAPSRMASSDKHGSLILAFGRAPVPFAHVGRWQTLGSAACSGCWTRHDGGIAQGTVWRSEFRLLLCPFSVYVPRSHYLFKKKHLPHPSWFPRRKRGKSPLYGIVESRIERITPQPSSFQRTRNGGCDISSATTARHHTSLGVNDTPPVCSHRSRLLWKNIGLGLVGSTCGPHREVQQCQVQQSTMRLGHPSAASTGSVAIPSPTRRPFTLFAQHFYKIVSRPRCFVHAPSGPSPTWHAWI